MIKIQDCGEPLVDVQKECPRVTWNLKLLSTAAEKKAYVRKHVAEMLRRAERTLPQGYSFLINDAWRPVSVQKEIFYQYFKRFQSEHPSWSKQRLMREVQKCVAPFSGPRASLAPDWSRCRSPALEEWKKVPMSSQKLPFREDAQSIQPKLPKYLQKN